MVKLFCAIVGVAGNAFEVDIDEGASVSALKDAIKAKKPDTIKGEADKLQLFLAKTANDWLDAAGVTAVTLDEHGHPRGFAQMNPLLWLKNAKNFGENFQPGEDQVHVLVVVPQREPILPRDVQLGMLMNAMQWRQPKPLCSSPGKEWKYQGASEIAEALSDSLAVHYNAWQFQNEDKQNHAINLVLSGPGTGKSRMLDEMKDLLYAAALRSDDKALATRMKNAYVFRVTFENGTSARGSLLDTNFPEFDVSYRMLYQLAKERESWSTFPERLAEAYPSLLLNIETVIGILAELENISNVKDMTVILCVDGLQKLSIDHSKTCDFYRVLTTICSFLISSKAFAVCVCSATMANPVREALADSHQRRLYLLPPYVRGEDVLRPRTRLEKQLVDDMGGHGRALEALVSVVANYTKDQLEKVDPAYIIDQVYAALQTRYGNILDDPFFANQANCQEILAAIISRRRYALSDYVGRTVVTVDDIRSFGLFRWTREGHSGEGRLECAFIILLLLMRRLPKQVGQVDNFDEHISRSVLVWQRFEQFVAFYRRVKSMAYCAKLVNLSTFHSGARFGLIDGILIKESSSRKVVEAINRHETKSGSQDLLILTNHCGNVRLSDMDTIVLNGASTSAGDLFMRVQLVVKNVQADCNEVIQCKLLKSGEKLNKATFDRERAKSVNDTDIFLLITSAELMTDFEMPARCGIVSKAEFCQYFGPFASRAYRSILEPPNINTASYHELRLINGVGNVTANKIIDERKTRRFSSLIDAKNRLFQNKDSAASEILSYMHCD